MGRVAGRLLNIPVIYTVHGFAFKPAAPWRQRMAARVTEWLLAPLTSRLICVAEGERELARALPLADARISVIRNGLEDVAQRAAQVDRCDASRWLRALPAPSGPTSCSMPSGGPGWPSANS
ncbi:glycosyltransferase [Cupriavidus basilensis]